MDHTLWDEAFLHKIEQLSLVSRRRRMGRLAGERRSPKRGSSVEFADYRNYTAGDDLRQLDWNIYARLEKLFVKLFEEEEDLTVHVLLDASRSMDWDGLTAAQSIGGSGASVLHTGGKFRYARRVAAAFGYIALSSLDRVWVGAMHGNGIQRLGPLRGRNHALGMLHFLEKLKAEGDTDLSAALRSYLVRQRQPGLCYVISDMLSPSGSLDGLRALQSAGYEVNLIHVLDPAEVNPLLALSGDLRLRDVETGEEEEVSIDPSTVGIYEEKYQVWQQAIASFCLQRSIPYILATTNLPFEDLILHYLRRRGMLA